MLKSTTECFQLEYQQMSDVWAYFSPKNKSWVNSFIQRLIQKLNESKRSQYEIVKNFKLRVHDEHK